MNLINIFRHGLIDERFTFLYRFNRVIKYYSNDHFKSLTENEQLKEKIESYFYYGIKIYSLNEVGEKFINRCKEYFRKYWKHNQKNFMNLVENYENDLIKIFVGFYQNNEENLLSPTKFIEYMICNYSYDIFNEFIRYLDENSFNLTLNFYIISIDIKNDLGKNPFLNKKSIKNIISNLNDKEYLKNNYSKYIVEHVKLSVHLRCIRLKITYNFLLETCIAIINALNKHDTGAEDNEKHEKDLFLFRVYKIKHDLVKNYENYFSTYEAFILE